MFSVRTQLMSAIVFVPMGLALAVSVKAQDVPILNPKSDMDVLTCSPGTNCPIWNYGLGDWSKHRVAKVFNHAISERTPRRTVRRGHWRFRFIGLHLADARRHCAGQHDLRSELGGGCTCGLPIYRLRCILDGRKRDTGRRSQSDASGRYPRDRGGPV